MRTKLDMRTIATNKIIANRSNPRSEIGDTSDLEADIKAHGLINPITVRRIDKGFEVVAGSRRLQACKNLGIETIDCSVIERSEEELFEIATAENVTRKAMAPSDECKAIQKMVSSGTDIHTVAANLGRTARWVIGRMKMAELGDEVLESLDSGKITLGHAEVLVLCDNDEEVKKHLEECEYNTPAELREKILSEKKNLSKAPFDAKKICKKCKNRTDTQQDIFGDISESYCRDGSCFMSHVQEFIEARRKECLDLGMVEIESYEWWFDYGGTSKGINVDGEHTEEEEETIAKLNKLGKHPYFRVSKDGVVTAKWCRDEAKTEEEEQEEEEESNEKKEEQERNNFIRNFSKERQKEIVEAKVRRVFRDLSNEACAVICAALDQETVSVEVADGETGESETVEESPMAHVDEGFTSSCGDKKTVSWKDRFISRIVDELMAWDGCDETHRGYFGIDDGVLNRFRGDAEEAWNKGEGHEKED